MKCNKCGNENSDSFRFCQFCGAAMGADAPAGGATQDLPMSSLSTPSSLDAWLIDEDDDLDFTVADVAASIAKKAEAASDDDEMRATEIDLDGISSSGELHTGEVPVDLDAESDQGVRPELDSVDLPVDVVLDDVASSVSGNTQQLTSSGVQKIPEGLSQLMELDTRGGHPSSPEARICKRCGELIAAGHRFCGKCGTKYGSGYDYTSCPPTSTITDASPAKRGVERVSFVKQHAPASMPEQGNCGFEVRHINDDGTEGDIIPIFEGENFIGRASSLSLGSDRYVSPHHIRLVCNARELTLEDCNSLNGVFKKFTNASVEIHDGDIFRIGEELLCYFHGSSAQVLLSNRTSEKTELLGNDEAPGWGYLRVVMGAYSEGSVYRLAAQTVSIGRTHADILFQRDGFVSGTHATIRPGKSGAILTDLGSSNGTFVRIRGPLKITEPIHILIGNQLLRIAPM